MKKSLLFAFLACLFLNSYGQFGAWPYYQSVTAVNQTGSAQGDYQIRLIVDTQTLIGQNKLETDGRDLRFGDPCATVSYDYWIEDYLNTDSTIIWVRLDTIDAAATASFGMYYGNPAATAASSFSATFPNAIQTSISGSVTVMPGVNYGWIEVASGDTLYLAGGVVNNLNVRVANIQGSVWGVGRGFQAPPTSNNGNGPGGGAWGSSSGAAGGSYGGLGGIGGYDASDPIQQPGPIYGTTTGPDIDMGSTGGSASSVIAGNGGGAVRLTAEWLSVSGAINCNATLAQQPGGGQGAGGSAGGGILLHGDQVTFSGSLTANGSGGSIGTSTANDDGGGGGGGRIKIFYGNSLTNTGSTSVQGGPGGQNGGAGTGAPGALGTVHVDTLAFNIVSATLGAEQPNSAAAPVVTAPSGACAGDSVTIALTGGYSSYTFEAGGNQLQTGLDSTYSYLADSSQTFIVTVLGACTYVDTVQVDVFAAPIASITVQAGTFCDGDSVELSVSPGFSSVAWSNGGTANNTFVTTAGNYSVVVTDSNTCSGSDTVTVSYLPAPNPVITLSGGVLSTGTYTSYQWLLGGNPIPGATSPTYAPTASGTYSVTVTDSNGCTGTAAMPVVYVGIDASQLAGLKSWPNPSTGLFHLQANFPSADDVRVRVMDLTGRTWLDQEIAVNAGEWTHEFDLGDFAAGVYFFHLQSEAGQAVLRVIKE